MMLPPKLIPLAVVSKTVNNSYVELSSALEHCVLQTINLRCSNRDTRCFGSFFNDIILKISAFPQLVQVVIS